MRVVQVITELRPAGAERIVADLCAALKAKGHAVTVVALMPLPESSPIVDELRAAGVDALSLNVRKCSPWRMLRLRHVLWALGGADIVHAHLIHANLASRLSSFGRRHKLVNTVHIAERRRKCWWHFVLDRLTLFLADVETVVSKSARDYHAARLGVPPERLPVIHNGVKPPGHPTPGEVAELRAAWGVADCAKVVGSVGRLDWQKGYDILLGLLPELSRRVPPGETWAVVLLGEGKERPALEKLAAAAPANLKVRLPGFVDRAAWQAGGFDVFAMPSRYEGFGLTLAEAMTHGLPILANDIDSLPELLERYEGGQVIEFSARNAAAVAERLAAMAAGPKFAPANDFSLEAMTGAYADLYEALLQGRKPG